MLQDFQSVSDHFTTLRSKELRLHSQFTVWIITFREYWLIYSERPVTVLSEFGPVNKVYFRNILAYVDSKLEVFSKFDSV